MWKTLKQKKIQDNHSHDYPVISFFPQNKKINFVIFHNRLKVGSEQ